MVVSYRLWLTLLSVVTLQCSECCGWSCPTDCGSLCCLLSLCSVPSAVGGRVLQTVAHSVVCCHFAVFRVLWVVVSYRLWLTLLSVVTLQCSECCGWSYPTDCGSLCCLLSLCSVPSALGGLVLQTVAHSVVCCHFAVFRVLWVVVSYRLWLTLLSVVTLQCSECCGWSCPTDYGSLCCLLSLCSVPSALGGLVLQTVAHSVVCCHFAVFRVLWVVVSYRLWLTLLSVVTLQCSECCGWSCPTDYGSLCCLLSLCSVPSAVGGRVLQTMAHSVVCCHFAVFRVLWEVLSYRLWLTLLSVVTLQCSECCGWSCPTDYGSLCCLLSLCSVPSAVGGRVLQTMAHSVVCCHFAVFRVLWVVVSYRLWLTLLSVVTLQCSECCGWSYPTDCGSLCCLLSLYSVPSAVGGRILQTVAHSAVCCHFTVFRVLWVVVSYRLWLTLYRCLLSLCSVPSAVGRRILQTVAHSVVCCHFAVFRVLWVVVSYRLWLTLLMVSAVLALAGSGLLGHLLGFHLYLCEYGIVLNCKASINH